MYKCKTLKVVTRYMYDVKCIGLHLKSKSLNYELYFLIPDWVNTL